MSIVGIYSLVRAAARPRPALPGRRTSLIGALSTGLFVVMWNYMGWELPTAAGDEIVNPSKNLPAGDGPGAGGGRSPPTRCPLLAGLYGGAGDDGRYQLWGIEEYESGEGIGACVAPITASHDGADRRLGRGPGQLRRLGIPRHRARRRARGSAGADSPLARILGITGDHSPPS